MSQDVPTPPPGDDNPFMPRRSRGAKPEAWANSAAVYVRMSTEHQQYSTSNQMDVIREYAKKRGLEIVKIFSDDGKSGLNLGGRGSLIQMIQEVYDGRAEYGRILVYDVSRWGRFQDPDESAALEYMCRQQEVPVHYCAEQFENDGTAISSIVKGIKRTMAAEYSRELSTKVFQGACRLVKLGFRQGGAAGFGLRRVLLDQSGEKKTMLKMGEQKSIQTDRVVLVAGPDEEIKVVRRIYREFITDGKIESEIAAGLNAQGILTDYGRAWNRGTVHQVLTNEKYIGNNVYSRTSCKLKKKHVNNPPEQWIRAKGAYAGTVSLRAENEPAGPKYDLVCGQGRMEAFIALGHLEIPAIVVEITKEERLIRSLVENIARRYPATMDLIREIERLRADGYNNHQISAKLDISDTMVSGLLSLKKAGEGRLLQAALTGKIPLWVAIGISKADTPEMQRELLEA
jgi:DNA invertase Pin-like site-specific DNA recombinase